MGSDVQNKPVVLVSVRHRRALTPVFMQVSRGGYNGYELEHFDADRDALMVKARQLSAARKPVAIITDSDNWLENFKKEIKMRSMIIVLSRSSGDFSAIARHDLHKVVRVDTRFTTRNDLGKQANTIVGALDALYKVPV